MAAWSSQFWFVLYRLRQVDVLVGQGISRRDAIRQISVAEFTYYRWRKKRSNFLPPPVFASTHRSSAARRRLLRAGLNHSQRKEDNQGENHEAAPLDQPEARGVDCNRMSRTFPKAITSGSPIYLTTDSRDHTKKSKGNGRGVTMHTSSRCCC